MTFEVRDSAGRSIAQRTLTIAGALAGATSTWGDLRTELNANGTGLGGYGSFALDAATGRMTFTPAPGFDVTIVSDSTDRNGNGVSVSGLHGLTTAATAGRSVEADISRQISDEPSRLAVGRAFTWRSAIG